MHIVTMLRRILPHCYPTDKSAGVCLPSTFFVHRVGRISLPFLTFRSWPRRLDSLSRPCSGATCGDQLNKQGFQKHNACKRMRKETQEFREKWGSGDGHCSKVKVPKWNPSQLYYTFSCEWKNMQGVKLQLMWTSGPEIKMIINHWVIRKQ